jgi:CheY-like chemotaxis protein
MSDCTFDPGTVEQQTCLLREAMAQVDAALRALDGQGAGLEAWSGFISALGGLLLPAAAVLFVLLMLRPLREVMATRKFTLKIAGFELSAQEVTDQIQREIADLQKQVSALQAAAERERAVVQAFDGSLPDDPFGDAPDAAPAPAEDAAPAARPGPAPAPARRPRRVLWVDDRPENNALLVASLEAEGIDVATARSTDEALALLGASANRFGAVISDLGRREGGRFAGDAGLVLLRRLRAEGIDLPFAIYTSTRGVATARREVRDAGGQTITDSPTDLRRLFIDRHLGERNAD